MPDVEIKANRVSFRADLLDGCRVALAGAEPAGAAGRYAGHVPGEMSERLRSLAAAVEALGDVALADEEMAAAWVTAHRPLHGLVFDATASFGAGGPDALRAMLDRAWRAARAVATGALMQADTPGRLLFVAPRPDAGPLAEAARAALENLARTLSVEWARYGITAVALTPGARTAGAELADLAGFLLSPAGAYYSGCRFELGAAPAAAPARSAGS
jgi:NAD(P)-dependent dehydrogenase (short-subunit alcohol dehydrogenase family)